ncbi:MAG: AIR carboxylase family protein [Halobacteria archaeon]|nr:AIR carboxylase family protein [Halobacteria archaeon]
MSQVERIIDELEEQAESDELEDEETPNIGIIMGSDSDFDVMMGDGDDSVGAYDALKRLGFEEVTDYYEPPESRYTFETYVVSAHRTPELMYAYARTAEDRGIDIIIAGAGGKSADLPNMTASVAYPVPVIGVPVQEKSVDSVIGMPTGAPIVATDAGKSFNAALSAAQFLSVTHDDLADRLDEYHDDLKEGVGEVSREMHESGTPEFRRRDE